MFVIGVVMEANSVEKKVYNFSLLSRVCHFSVNQLINKYKYKLSIYFHGFKEQTSVLFIVLIDSDS